MKRLSLFSVHTIFVVFLLFVCVVDVDGSSSAPPPPPPSFTTHYFDQTLDHFSFDNSGTFKQRYLVGDDKYGFKPGNPIFFYTGNEGDIVNFASNTGLIWRAAEEFNGLVVFFEHRFYGESIPSSSFDWLTSEQALADYAEAIIYLKNEYNCPDSPVVVFGGSYGGMLSYWMRVKYPHLVVGAIASSAPVFYFQDQVDPYAYAEVVTQDFSAAENPIRKGFLSIQQIGKEVHRYSELSQAFDTCSDISSDADVDTLIAYLENGLIAMAMVDYPYENSFLRQVPPNCVNITCDRINGYIESGQSAVRAMRAIAEVYYNGTGQAKCFNISDTMSGKLGMIAWDYQACTEQIMPTGYNGETDFFLPSKWDVKMYCDACNKAWKSSSSASSISPRPYSVAMTYGSKNDFATMKKSISNIFAAQGDLDPWKVGGLLESLSESVTSYIIEGGAHHLDLRFPSPFDPPSVIKCRNAQMAAIAKWIQ